MNDNTQFAARALSQLRNSLQQYGPQAVIAQLAKQNPNGMALMQQINQMMQAGTLENYGRSICQQVGINPDELRRML